MSELKRCVLHSCNNEYSLEITEGEISVWAGDACVAVFDTENNHIADVSEMINKPLTLEELRGMDGEPVWVSFTDDDDGKHAGWYSVNVVSDNITLVSIAGEKVYLYVMVKGEDRMYQVSAYRRKPEAKEEAE